MIPFLIYFVTSHDEYAKSRCGIGFETGKLYLKEIMNGAYRLSLTTHSDSKHLEFWTVLAFVVYWSATTTLFFSARKQTYSKQSAFWFNAIQL
jgi:hypothetical protein